jgi:hypothetical protein
MEKTNRKSIHTNLNKFDVLAKKDDFIEVTEWTNGEGFDITINDKIFSLTDGQIKAINYLIQTLDLYDTN